MTEKLSSRVGRLVSGSFNALVDAVENVAPEVVMEQAIREVDQAIGDIKAELGRTIAKEHLANSRLAEENDKHETLSAQVKVALDQDRSDLAEAAVSKILDIESQIPVLQSTISQCAEERLELERYISALEGRKREMKSELRQFREIQASKQRSNLAGTQQSGDTGSASVDDTLEKAESAFNRVLEKQTGLTPLESDRDRKNATKLAELEEITRQKQIEERLRAFKSQT